jgi:hypothetical protein
MGSGTVSMSAVIDNGFIDSDPGERIVFGASYRVNPLDQWRGWLSKHKVLSDDPMPVELWEADGLMTVSGLNRELYVPAASSAPAGSVFTDVERVNRNVLESQLQIPADRSQEFRNWLLEYGSDTLTGDSIGVLGDLINSGITVVGRPKHRDLTDVFRTRREDAVVYVQTNRGVLHALNYMSGSELWGFIPPNIFKYKLRDLRYDEEGWVEGNGLTRPKSIPMVLLDGMLIARDCEGGAASPRTLLTGYLGHGGNGFYTMDITEMDNTKKPPVFKWAIENARYGDETGPYVVSDRIKRWGVAAGENINYYNYTDLGLTINPGVYFTPVHGNADTTIGVLPGGLGHMLGKNNDTQGKVFYFFNPWNGSIRGKIDTTVNGSMNFLRPRGRSLGMAVSPIIFQENGDRKTIAFYTADSEGNILKCNTESDAVESWKMQSIFQLRTIGPAHVYEGSKVTPPREDLPLSIPRKMILAKTRTNYTWLLGGTSNLYAPGSASEDIKRIINQEQMLFGLNLNNILQSGEVDNGITPANAINEPLAPGVLPSEIRRMRYITYFRDNFSASGKYKDYGEVTYNYDESLLGIRNGMADYGWVMRLRPKYDNTEAEYLSADPFLMNNVLYIATFIPHAEANSQEACSDIGVGKLYAIDPSTGLSVMNNSTGILLDNIKIAGITGSRATNRLVLSIKELTVGANNEIYKNFSSVKYIGNNLYEIGALGGFAYNPSGDDPELDFEEQIPHVQYWREKF